MAGRLTRMLEWLVAVLMGLLCLDVLAGVVSRYVVARPLAWSEEVARYLFVWLSFLGAALGVKYAANFSLNLLAARLSLRGRQAMEFVGDLAVLVFGFLLVVQGWQILPVVALQRGSAVNVPLSAIYLAIPVSGVLIAWYSLARLWSLRQALRGRQGNVPLPGETPVLEGEAVRRPSEQT